jgi:hypothetical protein
MFQTACPRSSVSSLIAREFSTLGFALYATIRAFACRIAIAVEVDPTALLNAI